MPFADVAVIGAGVSGCAAAIALRQAGLEVLLLDQLPAGSSRFCGEFVSGEAFESLEALGVAPTVRALGPAPAGEMTLCPPRGAPFSMPLRTVGYGLSRRTLDAALADFARDIGVDVRFETAVADFSGGPREGFRLSIRNCSVENEAHVNARAVVGAIGKRSSLDRVLGRPFLRRPSRFIGVRRRFRSIPAGGSVWLHLFSGGYCGVNEIEEGDSNVCMLATVDALQAAGGKPDALIEMCRAQNGALGKLMRDAEPIGPAQAISQIPFGSKEPVSGGVFLIGDGAGVMAPFLGVGVATGLRSALAASECVVEWLRGRLPFDAAAQSYRSRWNERFGATQRWGHRASTLLCDPRVASPAISVLRRMPFLGRWAYKNSRP